MEKINSHKAIFTLDILALKLYNIAIKQNTLQGSHPPTRSGAGTAKQKPVHWAMP